MSKQKAKKKIVIDDSMSEEDILVEYIKAEAVDELEKLFEQYPTLNVNFAVYEADVKDLFEQTSKKKQQEEVKPTPPDKPIDPENSEEKSVDTPFTLAVRLKNIPIMECLFRRKANINDRNIRYGDSCLHIAVRNDDIEMLKALLKIEIQTKKDIQKIIDRNAVNENGKTAVLLAIEEYKPKLAELLLQNGSVHDFTRRNENNRMLIHEAAFTGDIKLLTTLIDMGQSPFESDPLNGMNVLHYAALGQKKEVFELLSKKKIEPATINSEDLKGETVLSISCTLNNWELVKLLISKMGSEINQVSQVDGLSIVHRAARDNNREILDKMAGLKAKLTLLDKLGNTPLHLAVSANASDAVKYLLEKKSDIKAQNSLGNTPFHHAAYKGHEEVLSMLIEKIEKKGTVNLENALKRTPLHEAASNGHTNVIPLLMSKGIELNAEDTNGMTALQVAINEIRIPFAIELVKNGANVERLYKGFVRDRTISQHDYNYVTSETEEVAGYKTIFQQVVWHNYDDLVEEMLKVGVNVDLQDERGYSPLHNAVLQNNLRNVTAIAARGAIVDVQDEADGFTPLMVAVQHSFKDICSHLVLTCNSSRQITDLNSKTALHYAAKQRDVRIVKLLIQNGSNVNHPDKNSRTPLFEAAEVNNLETADYLLDSGADIMFQDEQGNTPLHVAVTSGSAECTILFLNRGALMTARDKSGRTPLLAASQAGQTICGRLLVKAWTVFKETGKVDSMVLSLAEY